MSNFLNFIEEDIEAKKILISTLPSKTKRDIKKFNEKIDSISEKYIDYKTSVKKYIEAKSRSFNIKEAENVIEELENKIEVLEEVRFILNPTNTFLEKMKLDELLYQIGNYNDLNFNSVNEFINQFLDKFELAGIKLTKKDFTYTCYVNEYMTAFLEVRNEGSSNYDKIADIFEKIYWVNPDIINHIELNFRKLIRKNEKAFNAYITELQNKVKEKNHITSYSDCIDKLKVAYNKIKNDNQETINDIVELSKSGAIDINTFFANNKTRISIYNNMMIDKFDMEDESSSKKFYDNLEKLRRNINEYKNYVDCIPLINNFKTEFEKSLSQEAVSPSKGSNSGNSNSKSIEEHISEKEAKLEKINKSVMGSDTKSIFGIKIPGMTVSSTSSLRQMKIDSINLAQELYQLYKESEESYFKKKILSTLSKSLTVSEFLNIYYSFDYFKKIAIRKVFNLTNYDEIIKHSNDFDSFAKDPTNVITNSLSVFSENNIAKIIVNKYRLNNINLTEDDLNPNDLSILSNKIDFILRIKEIENSETTIEKIWFITQVDKLIKKG